MIRCNLQRIPGPIWTFVTLAPIPGLSTLPYVYDKLENVTIYQAGKYNSLYLEYRILGLISRTGDPTVAMVSASTLPGAGQVLSERGWC